jgi:predicted ATPase
MHQGEQKQFLLETHSEHLLLRILKRIRDTTNEKTLSSDLHLTNDQVSIYYFDPTFDGGTIVSQQFVTPLGDFYNDWPRGFFQEREGDLFD